MKKKIFLILLFLVILGTTCYAETWEYIGTNEHNIEFYIDKDSIKLTHKDYDDLWKCRVKVIWPEKDYWISFVLINNDTKVWRSYFEERYDRDNKLLEQREYKYGEWNGKSNNIWSKIVERIVKEGQK